MEATRWADPRTSAALQGPLARYWSLAPGQPIPPQILASIQVVRRSSCYTGIVPAWQGIPPAFLKVFDDDKAYAREVQGLQRSAATAPTPGVAVPQLLSAQPAEPAIFTEYVAGSALNARLRAVLYTRPHALDEYWPALGAWLRSYHRAGSPRPSVADFLEQFQAETRGYMDGLQALLGTRLMHDVELLMGRLADAVAAQDPLCVTCHGDFALHNIIVSSDRLWVTDLAESRFAPWQYDVERFKDSLEDVIGFFPLTASLQSRITGSLLAAYGPVEQNQAAAGLIHLGLKLRKLYWLRNSACSPTPCRLWHAVMIRSLMRRLRTWTAHALNCCVS